VLESWPKSSKPRLDIARPKFRAKSRDDTEIWTCRDRYKSFETKCLQNATVFLRNFGQWVFWWISKNYSSGLEFSSILDCFRFFGW